METLREAARKDLAIKNLQDKYSGKISINDKEVEDFYNNNRQRFVSSRGVALAMIAVDPADNSSQGITQNDAKNDAEAKVKIDNVYQRLKGGADFATVARATSEDAHPCCVAVICFCFRRRSETTRISRGSGEPIFLIWKQEASRASSLSTGSLVHFSWQRSDCRPRTLTLESPGVRQQITHFIQSAQGTY